MEFIILSVCLTVALLVLLSRPRNTVSVVGRKYLKIDYYFDGQKYIYFVPYNRISALSPRSIRGNLSEQEYAFHPGFIPKIKASMLDEDFFIVNEERMNEL